ncbi:flagellar FlbD family protein [Treponema lecithinolyticum]|jgi:orf4; initiates with GTG|uniref:Flagellar protein n=1 Tax=Treponema lecithinolyticum ATCC 700332 TaxID=1321815 RepID=A0ABN0NYD6_TRELE|nr:flagellar FlbD family protein [Treponema lecithinolyticum]ERJ92611.1 flagellar protein [Treponema lecithinolyticum ATCC 700332]
MIRVTRLDGSLYWINPHHIEYMETNPDVTLVMLSGKKLVIRDTPDEVIDKIIAYRKRIGAFKNEL